MKIEEVHENVFKIINKNIIIRVLDRWEKT